MGVELQTRKHWHQLKPTWAWPWHGKHSKMCPFCSSAWDWDTCSGGFEAERLWWLRWFSGRAGTTAGGSPAPPLLGFGKNVLSNKHPCARLTNCRHCRVGLHRLHGIWASLCALSTFWWCLTSTSFCARNIEFLIQAWVPPVVVADTCGKLWGM